MAETAAWYRVTRRPHPSQGRPSPGPSQTSTAWTRATRRSINLRWTSCRARSVSTYTCFEHDGTRRSIGNSLQSPEVYTWAFGLTIPQSLLVRADEIIQ